MVLDQEAGVSWCDGAVPGDVQQSGAGKSELRLTPTVSRPPGFIWDSQGSGNFNLKMGPQLRTAVFPVGFIHEDRKSVV